MADLREVRCSTDGERGANETQSAGHLLSTARRLPARTIADRLKAEIADSAMALIPVAVGEQVYFIGPPGGPVKIGRSTCVQQRLSDLQCGSPVKLEILAVVDGGNALERMYHSYFRQQRKHGEWFDLSEEMATEIRRHAW